MVHEKGTYDMIWEEVVIEGFFGILIGAIAAGLMLAITTLIALVAILY